MRGRHTLNRLKVTAARPFLRRRPQWARAADAALRERSLGARFARFGLEPIDVVRTPVERLLVQRPVLAEVIPVADATPLPFLDTYFEVGEGPADWSITRSMQFRLLMDHRRGELGPLEETDYWHWHAQLHEAGVNERPPDWIAAKVLSLVALYDSIAAQGYRYSGLSSYVWALERPLVTTRYGLAHDQDGLEIFDGHHRAAAAAAAGIPSLHVLLLRDVATHTSFGIPLRSVGA